MLSMPPATITSASPSWMAWAASTTAFSPEPQALFTVKLGTSFGTPPSNAATRPGFNPRPAGSTWPRITSSTCAGSRQARRIASRTATPPSLVAGVCASAPPRVPMAVRVALTITGVGMTDPPSSRGNVAPPAASRHPLDSDSCATETGARMARFALIMSGGGARGAYEAGVLSYVLDDLPHRLGRPVRFQILTGTSVGAIHACYVAATLGRPHAGPIRHRPAGPARPRARARLGGHPVPLPGAAHRRGLLLRRRAAPEHAARPGAPPGRRPAPHRRAPPHADAGGGGRARRTPRGELQLARLPRRQGAERAPPGSRRLRRRPAPARERDPRHRRARLRSRVPPPHQPGDRGDARHALPRGAGRLRHPLAGPRRDGGIMPGSAPRRARPAGFAPRRGPPLRRARHRGRGGPALLPLLRPLLRRAPDRAGTGRRRGARRRAGGVLRRPRLTALPSPMPCATPCGRGPERAPRRAP